MTSSHLITVDNLVVELTSGGTRIVPVDGVSLAVRSGEITGLVGESGSGKTLTCRTIAGLLPTSGAPRVSGRVNMHDTDRPGRAGSNDIAMIFQNPSSYLDPLMPVWKQVAEPLIAKEAMRTGKARLEAIELMRKVGIPDPKTNAGAYPHQLSGGMKQRVMIAAALACRPKLLIADEPTTALDVTVQMQILRLLLTLRKEAGLTIILVTHDLAVIATICDTVNVMYCGKIVEQGSRQDVLSAPGHPYTRALVRSSPRWEGQSEELEVIGGQLPPLTALPRGCRYHPRCEFAIEQCRRSAPALRETEPNHRAACFRAEDVRASR